MDISRHISYLLFDHECVIVPGLGGFVSNYAPAKIHPVQHLFQPPSKTILFNPELKNNDGLLANFIAESEKISFSEALAIIDAFVNSTRSSVKSGQKLKLEKIGVLHAGIDGRLLFDQDKKANYLKASYGFSSFISPMINRRYRKVTKKPETKFTDRHDSERPKTRKQTVVWALVLIPLFIVFGWISLKTQMWNGSSKSVTSIVPVITEQLNDAGTTENAAADFNESNLETEPSEAKPVAVKTEEASFIPDMKDSEITHEEISIPETKVEIKAEVAPSHSTPAAEQRMYHLIGGSFARIENADKLIMSYKKAGYEDSRVIGQATNGNYRVSISAYPRKDDAVAELKKVRENYNSRAWILRQ